MKPTFEEFYNMNLGHLNKAKELPFEVEIKIISAINCCDSCKVLAERIYTLEEAFRLMPIPNKQCNHDRYGHCRCRYIPIPKRDNEGRLILKK